jgi:hypothetical protein
MSDELKEFVHERFRRTDSKLDQLIELSTGLTQRLGSVEQQLASLRTDFAHLREDFVRIEHRLDRASIPGLSASSSVSIWLKHRPI